MFASFLNTIVGIWLVYVAVLQPSMLESRFTMVLSAVILFALAIQARRGDFLKWTGTTTAILAGAMFIYSALWPLASAQQISFWIAFWIGATAAVLSLWSAIYREPGTQEFAGVGVGRRSREGRGESEVHA